MLVSFDSVPVCDRQTDRQSDMPLIASMHLQSYPMLLCIKSSCCDCRNISKDDVLIMDSLNYIKGWCINYYHCWAWQHLTHLCLTEAIYILQTIIAGHFAPLLHMFSLMGMLIVFKFLCNCYIQIFQVIGTNYTALRNLHRLLIVW